MNCDSTRNSVQGLQSVILLINDTSSFSLNSGRLKQFQMDVETPDLRFDFAEQASGRVVRKPINTNPAGLKGDRD